MKRLLEVKFVYQVKLFVVYARIMLAYQYSVDSLFCPPSADLECAARMIEQHINFDFDYEGLRYDVAKVKHMLRNGYPYVKYTPHYLAVKMARRAVKEQQAQVQVLEAVA